MEERDIQDRGSKVTEGTSTGYPLRMWPDNVSRVRIDSIKQQSEHI